MLAAHERPSLSSAVFNVREITKQMLLLEDHLADDDKYCVDCIRKHLLLIEALAEEAVAIDPASPWTSTVIDLAKQARAWQTMFEDGKDKHLIGQYIRERRKILIQKVFDPRA
jgi:hypothetical protein